METIVAVLHHKMDYFFWTGFYLDDNGEMIVNVYLDIDSKEKGSFTAIDALWLEKIVELIY